MRSVMMRTGVVALWALVVVFAASCSDGSSSPAEDVEAEVEDVDSDTEDVDTDTEDVDTDADTEDVDSDTEDAETDIEDVDTEIATALAFEAQPTSTLAGVALSPEVTVVLVDRAQRPVSGPTRAVTISLQAPEGEPTLLGTTTTQTDDGRAVFADLALERAGRGYRLVATADGLDPATSEAFDIAPGPLAESSTTLSSSPQSARADDVETLTLTTLAADAFGNALPDIDVSFSLDAEGGTLEPESGVTDDEGALAVTLRSSRAGLQTVTASFDDGRIEKSVEVSFVAGALDLDRSSASLAPPVVVADGMEGIVVQVVARDAFDNPIAGQAVEVVAQRGEEPADIQSNGLTDDQGVFETTLVTTVAGERTVRATFGEGNGDLPELSANFVPGPVSAAGSTFEVTPESAASWFEEVQLRVVARDAFGNVLRDVPVAFTFEGDWERTLELPDPAVTDGDGALMASLQTRGYGTWTATATLGTAPDAVQLEADVTFERRLPDDYCREPDATPVQIGDGLGGTRALEVWRDFGVRGEGVRIGIMSSGLVLEHEALTRNYAGAQADGRFDHNYAWFDYFERTLAPVDTRTIGTVLTGVVAGVNPDLCIGVAPESSFASCRVYDPLGRETPLSQQVCYRFFLEPHDLAGENPRPELRPDVVMAALCEGCVEGDELLEWTEALRAAGVVVVASAGPSFPGTAPCGKVVRSPSNYPNVLAVSATGADNLTLSTSAVGPGWFNDDLISKPDLATIAEHAVSSLLLDDELTYAFASGSTVAASITTGVVALVISANPALRRQPRIVEEILRSTAMTRTNGLCDLDPTVAPNSQYGHGMIDAYAAVERALTYPYGGCPERPLTTCHTDASDAAFTVSQTLGETPDTDQELRFTMNWGTPLPGAFGNPDTDAGEAFRLCVYDTVDDVGVPSGYVLNSGFSLGTSDEVAAGAWSRITDPDGHRFVFASPSAEDNDGIVELLADEAGALHITGQGTAMPLSRVRTQRLSRTRKVYEAHTGVVVQLHATATDACWEAHFQEDDVEANDNFGFSGRWERP